MPNRRRLPTRAMASVAIAVTCVALSGCSASDPSIWHVAPLSFDNTLDGGSVGTGSNFTDVTYGMDQITGDTIGGFWTESAGSWLHIDADGRTASRFNTENTEGSIEGLAALTPTLLAVAHGPHVGFETATRSTVSTFDTITKNWTEVALRASSVGDLATDLSDPAQPRIVFVDFFGAPVIAGQERSFGVSVTSPDGQESALVGAEADLSGDDVDIAIGPGGGVLVSTDTRSFRVAADGSLSDRSSHARGSAFIAVSPAGLVLSRTGAAQTRPTAQDLPTAQDVPTAQDSPTAQDVPTAQGSIRGGSPEARIILEGTEAEPDATRVSLVLTVKGRAIVVPFTTGAVAAAWLDDGRFVVVSPGSGDESVLAIVTLPADE